MNAPFRTISHDCGHPLDLARAFCPSCGAERCRHCLDRGVCDACLAHALDTIRSAHIPMPPPRAPEATDAPRANARTPSRGLIALSLGCAMLGIVSASAAAIASSRLVSRLVEMRPYEPTSMRHARHVPHGHMAGPNPQPAQYVPPAPPPAARAPIDPSLLQPASVLAHAGDETHDPVLLVSRARRLVDAGSDLMMVTVRFRHDLLDDAMAALTGNAPRVLPVYEGSRTLGLQFVRAQGPLMAMTGVRDGDILMSVNGYDLSTLERGDGVFHDATRQGLAVAELVRGGHRIVLVLSWPDSPPGPRESATLRTAGMHSVEGAPVLHPGSRIVTQRRDRRIHQHGPGTRVETSARSGGGTPVQRAR